MATDKKFEAGDLVLVRFPRYGYWPAKIVPQKMTAHYTPRKGGRKIVYFGEHEQGFAYTADMKYYDDSSKMKYISKTSLKKYPALTKALEQISLESLKGNSADSAKTMRLPSKGKNVLGRSKERIDEVKEPIDEVPREGKIVQGKSKERSEEVKGPIDEAVDVSQEVLTNENVKESNLNSNDSHDDPIEELFNFTREFHTVPCPDVCKIISQPTKANENKSQPFKRFKLASGSKTNENKCQTSKRFKLATKTKFSLCDGNDNPDPSFQFDLFDYEIKVETELKAEKLENDEASKMEYQTLIQNGNSVDRTKTMRLPREAKNVQEKSTESNEEVEETSNDIVDISEEVPTNENVKESSALFDNHDDPIEEPFNSPHEVHTVLFPDVCENISQPTKANEKKSQVTKRFKLARKTNEKKRFKGSEDSEKTVNPDPLCQPDLFDYEIKVETESSVETLENDDAERMQVNEPSGSNNSQNEDSPAMCTCTGHRISDDTVKINMEIEMSSASFARVAHVLPSSLALKLRQTSKNPSILNK